MFGLMRERTCRLSKVARRERATLYCGTCKSIGRLYGQPARLLLNHDTVFLGELLLALAPPQRPLAPAFTPRRCATLPARDDIPLPLVYAATANVVLAQFAIDDRIADVSRLWHGVRLALYRPFALARRRLQSWQFPVDALARAQKLQAAREKEPIPADREPLAYLAEPTAILTAAFFAHGGRVVGADDDSVATLERVGDAFGRLVYILDAICDRVEDARRRQFNAIAAARASVDDAIRYVFELRREIVAQLARLPIDRERRALFSSRLRLALDQKLRASNAAEECAARAGGPLPIMSSTIAPAAMESMEIGDDTDATAVEPVPTDEEAQSDSNTRRRRRRGCSSVDTDSDLVDDDCCWCCSDACSCTSCECCTCESCGSGCCTHACHCETCACADGCACESCNCCDSCACDSCACDCCSCN